MRILMTGAAGYVGSVAFHYFKSAGHELLALDDLSTGVEGNVPPQQLVRADVGDRAAVRVALQAFRPQAIIHFAGAAIVAESVRDPAKYYRVNVASASAFLEALRETSGALPFLYSSSAAVYGVPAQIPIPETAPLAPIHPYGETKLWVERILLAYAHAYGWPIGILRYFNAAGAVPAAGLAERHSPETHLIPNVVRAAAEGAPIEVFGTSLPTPDGTCVRDYIHVLDLAEAHGRALEYLAHGGGTFVLNLGTGRGYSVREVIDAARRVTGRAIAVREAPPRAGDPPTLVADPSRARRVLAWEPRHSSLEEILESAWAARALMFGAGRR